MIQDILVVIGLVAIFCSLWFGIMWLENNTGRRTVYQRNCVAGGDIVGGDVHINTRTGKTVRCKHCGALQ